MKKTKDLLGKALKAMDAVLEEYEKEPGFRRLSELVLFERAKKLMEKT